MLARLLTHPLILGLLLILQIGLIVMLNRPGHVGAGEHQATPFYALDNSRIDRLQIDSVSGSVVLAKQDGQWVMPEYHGLPADQDLVSNLLNQLSQSQPIHPVGRTREAAQRFKVAEQSYQRRLVLSAGEQALVEYYFGDSPGYRKIYARQSSHKDIYAIKLGLHLLPDEYRQWLNKTLIKPDFTPVRIMADDFVLVRGGNEWMLSNEKESEKLGQDKARERLRYLLNIQVSGVFDSALSGQPDLSKPDYRFRLEAGEQSIEYRFYKTNDQTMVMTDRFDVLFNVEPFIAEQLESLKRVALLQEQPAAEKQESVIDSGTVKPDQ